MKPRMTREEAIAAPATMAPDDFPTVAPEDDISDEAAQRLVSSAHEMIARRGRPSLTAPGMRSPQITLRLSVDEKERLAKVAHIEDRRPSDVVRSALGRYLNEKLAV